MIIRSSIFDAFVKSRSHTKITEITKKNLNDFNVPFFVALPAPSVYKLHRECWVWLSVALFLAIV